jgi:predicted nucleic acid-binding protein
MVLLDTSVLVAAFTKDAQSERAEHWLDRAAPFLVSDWAAAEFSSAIRTKVRQGYLEAPFVQEVETFFDAWSRRQGGHRPVISTDHVVARLLVSRHVGLRAPDALHLAIALRLGAVMATFDRQQEGVALAEGLEIFVP